MKPATLGRSILRRPSNEDRPPTFETLSYTPSYGTEDDAFDEEMRERQYEPCGGGRRIVRKRLGE